MIFESSCQVPCLFVLMTKHFSHLQSEGLCASPFTSFFTVIPSSATHPKNYLVREDTGISLEFAPWTTPGLTYSPPTTGGVRASS